MVAVQPRSLASNCMFPHFQDRQTAGPPRLQRFQAHRFPLEAVAMFSHPSRRARGKDRYFAWRVAETPCVTSKDWQELSVDLANNCQFYRVDRGCDRIRPDLQGTQRRPRPLLAKALLRFQRLHRRQAHREAQYMHRNPVTRGLVAKPEDWSWSSFHHYVTGEQGRVEIESPWTARTGEHPLIAIQPR
jgi:hypothetical protein